MFVWKVSEPFLLILYISLLVEVCSFFSTNYNIYKNRWHSRWFLWLFVTSVTLYVSLFVTFVISRHSVYDRYWPTSPITCRDTQNTYLLFQHDFSDGLWTDVKQCTFTKISIKKYVLFVNSVFLYEFKLYFVVFLRQSK